MNTNMAKRRRNLSSGTNPYVFVSYEHSLYFGYIAVVDPAQNKIIERIMVGPKPVSMCLNNQEDKLYVVSNVQDSVTIIDAYSFKVIKTLPISSSSAQSAPVAIFAAPRVNKVYVAHSGDKAVTIIDADKDEVIAQVELPDGSGYPFAFAGNMNNYFVFVACKSKDNDKGNVVGIDVEYNTAQPVGEDIELEFDGIHNPLTFYPNGAGLVTFGPTGMVVVSSFHAILESKATSLLDNTVSGVYLDNNLLFCTSQEDRAYLKKFKNLFFNQQGNITYDEFTEPASFKGQDKIRATHSQNYIGITIKPTTSPTGGLQLYDVNTSSSKFVSLPYVGDLAFAGDSMAYVGEVNSIVPIDVGTATVLPALLIGYNSTDRITVNNIICGYSNQSLNVDLV
ncbi:YncE family protein [Paenibacillus sp. FSL R7-0333]|uniref:YncE family protein n=1 Tax=Paenibacillus sp. FSL R7-0333 TaxID=1926587 RepID=UPI00096DA112|nr:hypothetical protein BK146_31705 [Paenibacillus sp. FSL R7-0333]